MHGEYLAYNDKDKKTYICDENMNISEEFLIGECFVDFMEIDFVDFKNFYYDMERMFNKTYSLTTAEDSQIKVSINKKNVTAFFNKYPILKKEVIKDALDSMTSIGRTPCTVDVDDPHFEQYFDLTHSSKGIDMVEQITSDNNTYSVEDLILIGDVSAWISDCLNTVHGLYEQTWKFIYEYKNDYIGNLSDIINHPYLKLSCDTDGDQGVVSQLVPQKQHEAYHDAYVFCFDVDYSEELNMLDATERLYLFNKLWKHNHIYFTDIKTSYRTVSLNSNLNSGEYFNDELNISFVNWVKKNKDLGTLVHQLKEINIQRFQLFPTYHLANIVGIEFQKMVEHNIKIKKCRNCGKYFVLKGDYATDYCDRIPEDETSTCKKIAAIKARKNKVKENPILKEYEKAYKRMYARASNKKIAHDDFLIWSGGAMEERDRVSAIYKENPSEELLQEFKDFLGNK